MASEIFIVMLVILASLTLQSASHSLPNYSTGKEDPNQWPSACEGRNYCWIKNKAYEEKQHRFDAALKGQSLQYRLGDELGDRSPLEWNDIGNCKPSVDELKTIYMLKDENGKVWYVPQNENYTMSIQIKECEYVGRIKAVNLTGLDDTLLEEKKVYCVEQNVAFQFPVLHKNEIILKTPHKGLPLSCSAKILK